MKLTLILTALSLLLPGLSQALADEVSVAAAGFKNEKNETGGDDAGGEQSITVQGRYGIDINPGEQWVIEASIIQKSYDNPKDGDAPDDGMSINAGFGKRWFFNSFGKKVRPYLLAVGSYFSDYEGSVTAQTETKTTGLRATGYTGFRFIYNDAVFMELEATLMSSDIFSKEETKPVESGDGSTETETSKNELFASTFGNINTVSVGLGYRF